MLYTLIKHATISQSESLLECFKWSDWLKKIKAVIVKPSKFTICDSSQTEIVWLVEFNTFAWLRKFLYSFNTESESGMSSELWLVKTRKFFHMINNLLKAFVLWMNYGWIHGNSKIYRNDSAVREREREVREMVGHKFKLVDDVTALAQLRVLYSDRARSFNQWQRVLHANFIMITINKGGILVPPRLLLKDRI